MVSLLTAGAVGGGLVLTGIVGSSAPPTEVSSAVPAQQPVHDHADHDHASTLDDDGRFTGPGEVRPPRIRNAEDEIELDYSNLEATSDEWQLSPATADELMVLDIGPADRALADDDVRDAVGANHNLISVTNDEVVPGSDKGDADELATLVVYYNLDEDTTVEVFINDERVVAVETTMAADGQPPLSAKEKFRAAELARAHWAALGDERLASLEGFSILANRPGGANYNSRVAYVSFHEDNTSDPELLTWVDLTDETILDSRVDR